MKSAGRTAQPPDAHQRTGISWGFPDTCVRSSEVQAAGADGDGAQIAVPALDRVLLGKAMATEQLHGIGTDLHRLLGTEDAGQGYAPRAGSLRHARPGHRLARPSGAWRQSR